MPTLNPLIAELWHECMNNAIKGVRVRVRWWLLNAKGKQAKKLYEVKNLRMQREVGCEYTLILTPQLGNEFGVSEHNDKTLRCQIDVTYKQVSVTHVQDVPKLASCVVYKIPAYRIGNPG